MTTEQTSSPKVPSQPVRTELELAQLSFLPSREATRCSPATLTWYRKYLGEVVAYLSEEGVRELTDIQPNQLRLFLIRQKQRGLADQTVFHYASAARAFFYYLEDEEWLPINPMRKVKMPRVARQMLPSFTPEEVKKLLDACRCHRDRAMVLCLVDTGCRAAEFVALNVGDVNIDNGTVMVLQGKGRKPRVTFLGAKARRALLKHLVERKGAEADDPLWISSNTKMRLTHHGLRLALKRIGERAGVVHANPHTFRRTCALWSLRAGMNIYALQQIMGHADLSAMLRYLALVENDLAYAHKKHGAVDNML